MDIVARAQNILRTPREEWPVIAVEPADITGLYTGYAVILAAIPLVAELIHYVVGGAPFGIGLAISLTGYVMSLINVAVVALIASKVAPRFGGVDALPQAFKLAVYGSTAAWVGGVFLLLPWVGGVLRLACALYSVYLFYLGITELVLVPAERRIGYFAVVIVATIVVAWIIAAILIAVTGLPHLMALR